MLKDLCISFLALNGLYFGCGKRVPADLPDIRFEVPNYPEARKDGYSSKYAPDAGFLLDLAREDLNSHALKMGFRELNLYGNVDPANVAAFYDGELAEAGFSRTPIFSWVRLILSFGFGMRTVE